MTVTFAQAAASAYPASIPWPFYNSGLTGLSSLTPRMYQFSGQARSCKARGTASSFYQESFSCQV